MTEALNKLFKRFFRVRTHSFDMDARKRYEKIILVTEYDGNSNKSTLNGLQ